MEGGSPTIVTNSEGGRTTPSVVAYAKNGDRLVGQVRVTHAPPPIVLTSHPSHQRHALSFLVRRPRHDATLVEAFFHGLGCLLYTSPSPRDS